MIKGQEENDKSKEKERRSNVLPLGFRKARKCITKDKRTDQAKA